MILHLKVAELNIIHRIANYKIYSKQVNTKRPEFHGQLVLSADK